MTWPPTRPVRKRLFGVVFLLIWVGGMYLCWGWTVAPFSPDLLIDASGITNPAYEERFGFSEWLVRREFVSEATGTMTGTEWHALPRGLAVALIMTAVSSLILYVGWRAAVGGFTGPRGTCDGCGYDLRALPAPRCPECGEATRQSEPRP